jgi:hypothetical protein
MKGCRGDSASAAAMISLSYEELSEPDKDKNHGE